MATRQSPLGVLGVATPSPVTKRSACTPPTRPGFAGDGEVRGTLAPGKLADFAVYPANPLSCPIDELRGLLPVLTVVGGHARHDPGGQATRGGTPIRANTSP